MEKMIGLRNSWYWMSVIVLLVVVMNHSNINAGTIAKPQFKNPSAGDNLVRLEDKVNEIEQEMAQLKIDLDKEGIDVDYLRQKGEELVDEIYLLGDGYAELFQAKDENLDSLQDKIVSLNGALKLIQEKLIQRIVALEQQNEKRRKSGDKEIDQALRHGSYDFARAKLSLIEDDVEIERILVNNYKETQNIDSIIYLASTLTRNVTRMAFIYKIMRTPIYKYSSHNTCDLIKLIDKIKTSILNVKDIKQQSLVQDMTHYLTELNDDIKVAIKKRWAYRFGGHSTVTATGDLAYKITLNGIPMVATQSYKLEKVNKAQNICLPFSTFSYQ